MWQERLKKEAEWASRQPKARQAKSKSREAAYEELRDATAQRIGDRGLSAATAGAQQPYDASPCWGFVLTNGRQKCSPGFHSKPGRFRNKFCPNCRKGIVIAASRSGPPSEHLLAAGRWMTERGAGLRGPDETGLRRVFVSARGDVYEAESTHEAR